MLHQESSPPTRPKCWPQRMLSWESDKSEPYLNLKDRYSRGSLCLSMMGSLARSFGSDGCRDPWLRFRCLLAITFTYIVSERSRVVSEVHKMMLLYVGMVLDLKD